MLVWHVCLWMILKDAVMNNIRLLSTIVASKDIPFCSAGIEKGMHCPMRMASYVAHSIQGLSSLVIGMPECSVYAGMLFPYGEGLKDGLHYHYVLDGREVVFGCQDGVSEAVREMAMEKVRYLLIIVTCIPELIGEDLESLAISLQKELSIHIAIVHLAQFINIGFPSGSWKSMQKLASFTQAKGKDPLSLNVLGTYQEEEVLFSHLSAVNYSLRYIGPKCRIEDIVEAGDARLNLVVTPYTQQMAVVLEQRCETPYIALHSSYRVADIDEKYNRIAEYLHLNLSDYDAIRTETMMLEQEVSLYCKGMRCVLGPRLDLPLELAENLIFLGLIPVLINVDELYPETLHLAKKLVGQGWDIPVCRINIGRSSLEYINSLSVDMILGDVEGFVDEEIIQVPNLLDLYSQVGYARTRRLLGRILQQCKNKVRRI